MQTALQTILNVAWTKHSSGSRHKALRLNRKSKPLRLTVARITVIAVAALLLGGLLQAGSALAQDGPTEIDIDFEGLAPGTPVTELTVQGLTITVETTGGIGEAWIFDSSAPTGGDVDLGTPNENCDPAGPGVGEGGLPGTGGENCEALGNILIIQENDDGIPDDAATGGSVIFTFSEAVIVNHFELLDFEEDAPLSISFLDADGNQLGTPISPTGMGDNSYERFDPAVDAGVTTVVTSIVMDLPISGAIGGITVTRAAELVPGSIGDTITCADTGAPLAGVLVELTNAAGETFTQTTATDGTYLFEELLIGEYTVTVDPSTITGSCNVPAVDPDGVLDNSSTVVLTLEELDNLDQDFAYAEPVGSIGDTITCADTDAPLAGVLVALTNAAGETFTQTTATDGTYLFENLALGAYTIAVDPSTIVGTCNLPAIDPDGTLDNTSSVTLTIEVPDNLEQDFAYTVPEPSPEPDPLGSIGDTITCVDTGAPLAGVLVMLTGADGALPPQVTTAEGTYLFEDLSLGEYTVTVDPSTIAGTCNAPSVDPDGTPDNSSTVTLTADLPNNLDQDFAYTEPAVIPDPDPAPQSSIGDIIFCDANGNGQADPNEGMAGVTVTLSGAADATARTLADGSYLFPALDAGAYTVTVDPSTIPETCNVPTADPDGDNDNTSSLNLGISENNREQDFGYVAPAAPEPVLGSIGNIVFCDANENGVPDDGEGLEGIIVNLSGDATQTTTTEADGTYLFSDLVAGEYTITVDSSQMPEACNQADVDPDGGNDSSSVVRLEEGEDNQEQNFGFVGTPPVIAPAVSVGNYVWLDADNNGIQDEGESGLGGVTVILYNNANEEITRTITSVQGEYLFADLEAGSYLVEFQTPDGHSLTQNDQGDDDAVDSDADAATGRTDLVEVPEGENLTLDAGVVQLPPQLDLQKELASGALIRGERGVFNITYGNRGGGPAENVTITQIVPEFTTLDPSNAAVGWICDGTTAGSVCTFSADSLAAGVQGDPLPFAVLVDPDMPAEINQIVCQVSINSDTSGLTATATVTATAPVTPGTPTAVELIEEPTREQFLYLPLVE